MSLHEDEFDTLRVARLELLLQIATPVLILAKGVNLALVILDLRVIEARTIICEN